MMMNNKVVFDFCSYLRANHFEDAKKKQNKKKLQIHKDIYHN